MKQIIGLYPGSFDPITNGHLDIIYRASKIVDTFDYWRCHKWEKETFIWYDRKDKPY